MPDLLELCFYVAALLINRQFVADVADVLDSMSREPLTNCGRHFLGNYY